MASEPTDSGAPARQPVVIEKHGYNPPPVAKVDRPPPSPPPPPASRPSSPAPPATSEHA